MLSPNWLLHCTDRITELCQDLSSSILRDQVRRVNRIGMSSTTEYQQSLLDEIAAFQADVHAILQEFIVDNDSLVYDLFMDAGKTTLKFDDAIYRSAGLSPTPLTQSPQLQSILRAAAERTNYDLYNLTQTAAQTATNALTERRLYLPPEAEQSAP